MKPYVLLHHWNGPLLTEYLDHRVAPRESRQLERHLAQCGLCARNLAQLAAAREALHALRLENENDEPPLPPWSAIEARLGERSLPIPFFLRHWLPMAGAACAVVVLALALVLYSPGSQPARDLAASRPESSDLYQFVGDRLFTPEKVLMGESLVIGPEVEEEIVPPRSYFHARSL
jgi:anti-sigma factor RsiW